MNFRSEQFKTLLRISGLVFLYGFACMLIFLLGERFGLSLVGRLLVIGLVLLTWPATALIDRYRRNRAKESDEATEQLAPEGGTEAAVEGGSEIEDNADQVIHWLKEAEGGGKKALYQLPWVVVAGPRAGGKSALLLSSSLDFQVLPNQRPSDHFSLRPTKDCEWYVTDSAVFIDTAGRYQSEGAGRNEWIALCNLLKKKRSERPVDAFVMSVDAHSLVGLSESEIEQEAKLLRARLDDFSSRVGHQFPVYLVFTNSDKIIGFSEFFAPYDATERAQAWGTTFPLAQSANAYALFDAEFDYLYQALMRRRLLRLSSAQVPKEQLLVFEFPLRFFEIREKLGLFTNVLFRPSPFRESPLFRGYYFTSCASEPGDELDFPDGEPGEEADFDESPRLLSDDRPAKSPGKGFFGEDFFKEVVLRDKDVAAALKGVPKRSEYLNPSLIAGVTLASVFSLVMLGISFFQNQRMIDDLTRSAGQVQQVVRTQSLEDAPPEDETTLRVELESLEALRVELERLDDHERNGRPMTMRFGLYSGREASIQARRLYFDTLQQRFCAPVFKALDRDLRASVAGKPPQPKPEDGRPAEKTSPEDELSRQYDLLKAYLMLSQPDKVKAAFLANQLAPYWKTLVPQDLELIALKQLEYYVNQAGVPEAPHIKADDRLVAESRRKLLAYPAVNRFYKRFITEIDSRVPPMSVEQILAGRGTGVIEGAYVVPGSFTLEGYGKYVQDGLDTAALEFSKNDWVMGETGIDIRGTKMDSDKLRSMYFREYTSHWQKFLRGVRIRQFRSREDVLDAYIQLSDPESPLETLLQEVGRQVQPSQIGFGGVINWVRKLVTTEKKVAAGEVEGEFGPFITFMNAKTGNEGTLLSQYRSALRAVLDNLQQTGDDQFTQLSRTYLTGKDELGLQKSEAVVAKLTETFKTDSSRAVGQLLRQPLGNLKALFYGANIDETAQIWGAQVLPAAQRVAGGFPFTNSGTASLTDLSKFLNPQDGSFTAFYKDKLAGSFENAQGQLVLRQNGAVRYSNEFVAYVNQAKQLQEALFAGGGTQPQVEYEVTLVPIPRAKVRLEIDGGTVEVQGTTPQAAKFSWPAKPGATSGARLVVTPLGGGQPVELSCPGEWGVFQLFGAGNPAATPDGQYKLGWTVGPVGAQAMLRPASAKNPFNRGLFTGLVPPRNILPAR